MRRLRDNDGARLIQNILTACAFLWQNGVMTEP